MKAFALAFLIFVAATPALASKAYIEEVGGEIYCVAHAQVSADNAAKNGETEKAKYQENLRTIWTAYLIKVAKKHGIDSSQVARVIQSEYDEYKDILEETLDWDGEYALELEGTGCQALPQ